MRGSGLTGGAGSRLYEFLDASSVPARAGHRDELVGAVEVGLRGVEFSHGQKGVGEVASEAGFGAVVGAVHARER